MGYMPIFYLHMTTTLELEDILKPILATLGLELVFITFISEGGRKTLRVAIDKPGGVTVEDCTQTSRQINAILDVEFPTLSGCDLEVSSPGLNRPLIKPEHYERFVGSKIKVSLHKALDGQRHFKGTLLGILDRQVTFESDGKALNVMLEDIEKANLIPELRFKQ